MSSLTAQEITLVFVALGIVLATASLLGEVARRCGQPALVGELLAGVVLGPTLLGRLWPDWGHVLFPSAGPRAPVLEVLTALAISMFLLVAGMQVRLSTIWRSGKVGMAAASFVIPFVISLSAALAIPLHLGCERDADTRVFAIFFAAAMAISTPSVVRHALVGLDLYRTDLGRVVSAAAVLAALLGWFVFAIMLGLLGQTLGLAAVLRQSALVVAFAIVSLTVGRWLIDRALVWISAYSSWPGGLIGLAVTLTMLAAAASEWLGIHYSVGPFLVGVALGDSPRLRRIPSLESHRGAIADVGTYVLSPMLFGSVGLRVDFAEKFDPAMIGLILTMACIAKLLGCALAARGGGMPWNMSWAVGFAMNARGAMLTVFGLIALQEGLIRPRMFVALVLLAVLSTLVSEPAIARLLRRRRPLALADLVHPDGLMRPLRGGDHWDAIARMMRSLDLEAANPGSHPGAAFTTQPRIEWAGPNQEVALCLVGSDDVVEPRIAVGVAPDGIDFGPLADTPIDLVVLVVTPTDDIAAESQIEAELVAVLGHENIIAQLRSAQSHTDLLAALRLTCAAGDEAALEMPAV